MELLHTDPNSIEAAYRRRLEETRATSGLRPLRPVSRSRSAFGPRLVQPGDRPSQSAPLLAGQRPTAKLLQLVTPGKPQIPQATNVLPIRPAQHLPINEGLLFAMAALGPLFWIAHATLTWLRILK